MSRPGGGCCSRHLPSLVFWRPDGNLFVLYSDIRDGKISKCKAWMCLRFDLSQPNRRIVPQESFLFHLKLGGGWLIYGWSCKTNFKLNTFCLNKSKDSNSLEKIHVLFDFLPHPSWMWSVVLVWTPLICAAKWFRMFSFAYEIDNNHWHASHSTRFSLPCLASLRSEGSLAWLGLWPRPDTVFGCQPRVIILTHDL